MNSNFSEQYIQDYFNKNQKDSTKVNLEKIKHGLSNSIYKASVNDKAVLFKVYGQLKEIGIINRKFEDLLIKINSEKKRIPSTLETDYKNYVISEYWPNLKHLKDEELLEENFLKDLIEKIIDFELSLNEEKTLKEEFKSQDVNSYLKEVLQKAKTKFQEFNSKFESWKTKNPNSEISFKVENLAIIDKYLQNFDDIFNNFKNDLKSKDFILSHNDIHKDNLLIFENDLKIFDYEYSCYNFIGTDIINYLIEGFFDLNLKEYPFYKVKGDPKEILNDEKNLIAYQKFIERLELRSNGVLSLKDLSTSKSHFKAVVGIMCLFWFSTALLFLDFDSNIDKTGFNYIDYAVDRLYIIS